MEVLTKDNILFAITVGAIIFGIFSYFHVPQESMEKKQALAGKEMDTKATVLAQKELETKALVLAEQVKGRNEENERRFLDMGIRLDTAMTTAQNHIYTVDVKVDTLIATVGEMSNEITRLTTIIDERIPKK